MLSKEFKMGRSKLKKNLKMMTFKTKETLKMGTLKKMTKIFGNNDLLTAITPP